MNHRSVPGASVVMWAGFLFHRSRSREKKPEISRHLSTLPDEPDIT